MESRDSSASPPAPSPEDDGVLSVTSALSKDAALHFQAAKFAECADVLRELLLLKPGDPKILHNIAIAEYFRNGCSDPKSLLDILNNVKKQSEVLAQASSEQLESEGAVGNKVVLAKGSNTLTHPFSANNSASLAYMDEFDTCVATLNTAVIWYNLHEYTKALSVLEPLYQNIGPIDETTALNICLLMLDVGLACNDASKSSDVLMYLEKAFGGSSTCQGDNGTSVQQQPNLVGKSSSFPHSSLTTDASEVVANSASEKEKTLSRTQSDEMLDLELESFSLARSAGISGSNNLFRNAADRPTSSIDLKLKLQLYKVRFLLLARNLKQAKREVKHAMNIARGGDSSKALLLKSHLEYARGNYRKAVKLLMASSNSSDTGALSTYHNNLGCVYYQLGKYHTSSVFFSKALTDCSFLRKEKPRMLSTFSQDTSLLIVYNCGMQYLACGKPIQAARCFQKAGLVFYNRPLLWLRLAETCIMAFEKEILTSNSSSVGKSDIRICLVGKGKWRRLVFEDGVSRNGDSENMEQNDLFLGSDRQPKLSLSLAYQCLHNGMFLLNHSDRSNLRSNLPSVLPSQEESEPTESTQVKNPNQKSIPSIEAKVSAVSMGLAQISLNGDTKDQKGGATQELVQNSLVLYEDIRKKENAVIKQALLTNLVYIELERGNLVKALSNARSLLEIPECSPVNCFLAHMYAAEALCLLNRPEEAVKHILVYLSPTGSANSPFTQEDWEKRKGDRIADFEDSSAVQHMEGITLYNPEQARADLLDNFAVLLCLEGELEQAHRLVSEALTISPGSPKATLTAVYVNIMLGNLGEALDRLKQSRWLAFRRSESPLKKV